MKKLLLSAAVVAVAFIAACDLEKTSNQLQANRVMVATVLSTPPVSIDPLALAGFDASFFYDVDGGLPAWDGGSFDGGSGATIGFTADGGRALTIEGQTAAFVFFGTRKDQSLSTPPDGIAGATVTVTPNDGPVTTLKEKGGGNYERTSQDDPGFKYQSGAKYTFAATLNGERFAGNVEKAPPLENISEFHPSKGYIEQAAGSAFVFTRPEPPANESRNLGFVTVFPIESNGQKGDPTYTNIPKTPLDFLKLIAAPAEWRGSPVTIPGSAFPQSKKTYIIIFQSVKHGGPETDNLFTGSALLAGTAEVGIVKTQ